MSLNSFDSMPAIFNCVGLIYKHMQVLKLKQKHESFSYNLIKSSEPHKFCIVEFLLCMVHVFKHLLISIIYGNLLQIYVRISAVNIMVT